MAGAAADALVLVGGRVLDPEGERFQADTDIACSGGRIRAVGRGLHQAEEYRAAEVIRIGGRHVVPGLIDSHFHLISRSTLELDEQLIAAGTIEGVLNARRQIEAGVTAVRDAGCRHHGIHALRRAIDDGVVVGPRAFVAGLNPTGTGAPRGWRNVIVDGVDEMRRAVRREHGAGADWIKLIVSHAYDPTDWARVVPFLSPAEISAAVEEAHYRGLRIGCHCEGWDVARLAAECGIDVLDHAALIDERVASEMAERGTGYVPTLWAFTDDTGLPLDQMPADRASAIRRWQEEHKRSIRRALAAGVIVAAGSDAMGAVPAGDVLLREMRALTEAGMSTSQALRAATLNGAKVLGQEADLGSIAPGKFADLVVLDGDPLERLDVLASPRLIVKEGRVLVDTAAGAGSRADERLPAATVVTTRWD